MLVISNKKKETDNVIIFVHIPKTGGATLCAILEKEYKDYYDIQRVKIPMSKYLQQDQTKKLEVIRGHFGFGIHKLLPQKKYTYITILRDPIERVISAYYYIRRSKPHKLHDLLNKITLNKFVTNRNFHHQTFNMQTRMLTGNSGTDLEIAKKNLKNYFSIVGITERYDETLYVMKKKYGWKIDNYRKRNVTLNRPSVKKIPKETIEIIKKKNQNDIELYQFANKLLNNQLQQLKN